MSDYFEVRDRVRALYIAEPVRAVQDARAEPLDGGFLTEVGGRVVLTAPARRLTVADELPSELAESWEKASSHNPFMLWLQGRFVEAEQANRNGAYWSTADLQFGEMSVRHGPLNWLHEETNVIGTIADNALIHPPAPTELDPLQKMQLALFGDGTYSTTYTTNTANIGQPQQIRSKESAAVARPYIAAVSSVWRWINPQRAAVIEAAAESDKLFYSMECVAEKIECASDGSREGCGQSFDYMQAMADPTSTCEHIASRSSARRMVNPFFLGGAAIVPPVQPGWADAKVDLLQAASLAEQAYTPSLDVQEEAWLSLMAEVIRFSQS